MANGPLILVGAITGAHGVKGEVRVKTFTAAPESIAAYGPLLDESGAVVLTPKAARPIKEGAAVMAAEIKTREQAEALRGARLYVPRDRLPAPEADEFYAVDLIGCGVENLQGAALGVVTAVQDFGAGEILEIEKDGAIWRLPFTLENAPHIDLRAKRIVADPPAGLLPEDVK